jgi:L-seryl-tRNA(Ser) seleniumtransferase
MALNVLPPVHDVLATASLDGIAEVYQTRLVRAVLARFRKKLQSDPKALRTRGDAVAAIVAEVNKQAGLLLTPFPRRVINGTGILIHTNLGRAPLGDVFQQIDIDALSGYSNLEWDAATQKRANRDDHLRGLLSFLTGAECALAVNNCASALLLALHTIANGKDVLVSRSELVEIGGGFRVPEIMEASGCHLVEVGTTNKTRIKDYEKRAREKETVLLKVHQSNFVQNGFVESVPLSDLVELGRRLKNPVVYDNGSGLLARPLAAFLDGEPALDEAIRAGASVAVSSADKLLGSIQAGLIVGRAPLIQAMRSSPLYRALRLDKVRITLLHYTLKQYLAGRSETLPLWHMSRPDLESVKERLRLPPGVQWTPLKAQMGGGTNPEKNFESLGLRFDDGRFTAQQLKNNFATRPVPIVGYILGNSFCLDVRTLLPADFVEVQKALDEVLSCS